jgi:hypothetical protein
VGQFVGERADLLVARSGGDDDLAALRITPTAGPVLGEVADLNAVVQLDGVGDERGDQVVVTVAGDRFCGRGERDGLPAGQRVGHRDVEDRDGAEEDLLLAGVLAVLVALLDGEGGEDADRLLTLADAAVAIEEGAEAGDVGRRDAAVVALDRASIWFPRLYLEKPLLARTLIQRCQPSVLSRARAACSMRSRSALRRASRSSSVSGVRLKRRAMVGSFGAWGPAPWRADLP